MAQTAQEGNPEDFMNDFKKTKEYPGLLKSARDAVNKTRLVDPDDPNLTVLGLILPDLGVEIRALRDVVKALKPLDSASQMRVLRWAIDRASQEYVRVLQEKQEKKEEYDVTKRKPADVADPRAEADVQ